MVDAGDQVAEVPGPEAGLPKLGTGLKIRLVVEAGRGLSIASALVRGKEAIGSLSFGTRQVFIGGSLIATLQRRRISAPDKGI